VLPPFNSFFSLLCSPWAAFSSCLANRLRNLKRDAAIEMDCGVFAFGFGYLENRQLPVASPHPVLYIIYVHLPVYRFFRGSCSQLCVFGLSMGLTHNRCSNFIAFPPFTFAGKYLFLFIYIYFCKINFTLGRLNAIQSGMLGPKTFVCVRVWQE